MTTVTFIDLLLTFSVGRQSRRSRLKSASVVDVVGNREVSPRADRYCRCETRFVEVGALVTKAAAFLTLT